MSTKATIAHGDDFHVYQEMFEGENVYIQIDKHGGFVQIMGDRITVSLPPSLLDQIARGWIENREKFDTEPNTELNLEGLKKLRSES
jgi:hypothetical protein|tara:strand:+ start:691 stop:951 length:261 start_codon:yes stop_codon:yes gene_type:complete